MPNAPKSRIKRRYTTLHSVADIARIDGYDCRMLATVEACIVTMDQENGMEFMGCFFWHDHVTSQDTALFRFNQPLLAGTPEAEFDSLSLIQHTNDILKSKKNESRS